MGSVRNVSLGGLAFYLENGINHVMKLWSQTVWRSLVCEPSVLFGTDQCLQNSELCRACPPLEKINIAICFYSFNSTWWWKNHWPMLHLLKMNKWAILFPGKHTLLFLLPAIVAKVWNVIILHCPLYAFQIPSSELFGELLSYIIWHFQVLSQPLLCVTCWPA